MRMGESRQSMENELKGSRRTDGKMGLDLVFIRKETTKKEQKQKTEILSAMNE